MDLGNVVYIIAVLAYFIYQATRKKKGQEMTDSDEVPEAPQKGLTFEDLMREIRQAQNPIPTDQPKPIQNQAPAPKPVLKEPYQSQSIPQRFPQAKPVSRRPIPVEDDEEIEYYEGTFGATKKSPYENYKETQSKPLVSAIKIDYDSLQEKRINPYAQLLKNPKTLKEAIIVSEILKPKHF
jgi:hypothetical protein